MAVGGFPAASGRPLAPLPGYQAGGSVASGQRPPVKWPVASAQCDTVCQNRLVRVVGKQGTGGSSVGRYLGGCTGWVVLIVASDQMLCGQYHFQNDRATGSLV